MMTKKTFLTYFFLFVSLFSFLPFFAHADAGVESADFQLVPENCVSGQGRGQSKDLGGCGWEDLLALINKTIDFLVFISASLSAMAFAYAGFLYMTAFGQSGKIEQAKGIINKTLIGLFFVLCGYLLVGFILKSLGVIDAFSLISF